MNQLPVICNECQAAHRGNESGDDHKSIDLAVDPAHALELPWPGKVYGVLEKDPYSHHSVISIERQDPMVRQDAIVVMVR